PPLSNPEFPVKPISRRPLMTNQPAERAFLVGIDYASRGSRTPRQASKIDSGKGESEPRSTALATRPTTGLRFSPEESLDELRSLAISAGAQVTGEFLQRRDKPDPATLIGRGKLEEIAGAAAAVSADLLIFDHDLTASQQRNIEAVVHTRVVDRTQL